MVTAKLAEDNNDRYRHFCVHMNWKQ